MKLIWKLAFRNIFRQKRRSILTLLAMGVGYVLFSLSIGLSDGSYANIISIFTRDHTGHVQIHRGDFLEKPSLYKTVDAPEKVGALLDRLSYVKSWAPRVKGAALAYGNGKTSPAQLYGIDSNRESKVTTLLEKKIVGRFFNSEKTNGQYEAVIGTVVAKVLKIQPGDELVLISQGADGSIANDSYRVVGIVGTPEGFDRMNIYLPLVAAQEFLSLGQRVHELSLLVKNHEVAGRAAAALKKDLKGTGLTPSPWMVIEEDFYRGMQVDMKGNYISIGIIMLLVAIGILNTVLMTILERTREYGVLKAIGTRPRVLFSLILIETGLLAAMSVAISFFVAFGVNWWFATYGIELESSFDMGGIEFNKMLGALTARSLLMPAAVTVVTALVVSIIPALRAVHLSAIQTLRSQ